MLASSTGCCRLTSVSTWSGFEVHLFGSGRALAMLASGEQDVAIGHAPEGGRRGSGAS
jgi:hypothetical protein